VEHTVKGEATGTIYLAVWAGLLALTAVTVALASLNLGGFAVAAALAVAAVKSALIAAYFMHLRYEKVRLYAGFVVITLVVLAIFAGLTIVDVVSR
jgi:cytochrome c oxidase subunit 4